MSHELPRAGPTVGVPRRRSDLKPRLLDRAGRLLSGLPKPTAREGHRAEVAGHQWQSLKLHLREMVKVQAQRLEEAMIDKKTGYVLDLQTSPLRVDNLDLAGNGTSPNVPPQPQKISLDLAGVSYRLPAGDTLELQVSTSTDSFVPNRGAATVTIAGGKVSVPTLSR